MATTQPSTARCYRALVAPVLGHGAPPHDRVGVGGQRLQPVGARDGQVAAAARGPVSIDEFVLIVLILFYLFICVCNQWIRTSYYDILQVSKDASE